MTPARMAQIHAAAFVHERGWTEAEFADLIQTRFVRVYTHDTGFALTRTLAGESELLTLAVDPTAQRRGTARALMRDWLEDIASEAQTAFLEVAADNDAALGLYDQFGFERSGLRRGYYARAEAPAVDALLMARALTQG